jgi:hypothetical protein
MHPPFGFALFYLRGIAPKEVKSSAIYWGAIPWVVLQLIMVGIVIFWPGLVTAFLDKPSDVDPSKIEIVIPPQEQNEPAPPDFGAPAGAKSEAERTSAESAADKRKADDLEDLFKK